MIKKNKKKTKHEGPHLNPTVGRKQFVNLKYVKYLKNVT